MVVVLTSACDLESNLLFNNIKVITRAAVYRIVAMVIFLQNRDKEICSDNACSNRHSFLRDCDWAYRALKLKYIINLNILQMYVLPVWTHAHINSLRVNPFFRFIYKLTRFCQILRSSGILQWFIACTAWICQDV